MIIHNGDHAEFEIEHANTPPNERPDWPLPSFDARDWAAAFIKLHGGDEGLMLAWFANALMRGFDEHAGRSDTTIARLEAWIADLQSGMRINCVYCGERFTEDDPVGKLKNHAETCIDHPMAKMQAENARYQKALHHYADQYCEGWCKENGGTFTDCGGCVARAAFAAAQPATGMSNAE